MRFHVCLAVGGLRSHTLFFRDHVVVFDELWAAVLLLLAGSAAKQRTPVKELDDFELDQRQHDQAEHEMED